MEPIANRIGRFQNSHPIEIIDTLLNSIDNYFNNEIRLTVQGENYQTSLLFIGIHAVALTIAEGFFNLSGPDGYKKFLESYVDGDSSDTKFSDIAVKIHNWRNILAHQWLGVGGYDIGYDYDQKEGWVNKDSVIFINPRIYCEHYLAAFKAGGRIWDYDKRFSEAEMEAIKTRLITKFLNR